MSSRRYVLCLSAIVGLGCVARLALIAKGFGTIDDPDNYLPLAKSLLDGQGFAINGHPSAYRPPLYPILLVPIAALGPKGVPFGLAGLQLALGALTVVLTALTLKRRQPDGNGFASLIGAAIVAFDPVLVSQSRPVMTETLAATLTAATCLALTFPSQTGTVCGGLIFGLGALCRPSLWPGFVLTLLAGLVLGTEKPAARVRSMVLMAVSCLIVVAPWTIRNWFVFGEPIATTTHGGYTLYLANNNVYYDDVLNAQADAVWTGRKQWLWWDSVNRETRGMAEPVADRYARRQALLVIRDRPIDFVRASLARLGRFWGLAPSGAVYSWTLRIASTVWTLPLWIALAIGLSRRRLWVWPSAVAPALVIGLSLVHTFFWTDLRMRASIVPAAALIAAASIRRFPRFGQGFRQPRTS